MREIIFHQLGQCGNQIGLNFWEYVAAEHSIDYNGFFQEGSDLQLQRIDVYFNEVECGNYVPRVIMSDLENGSYSNVSNSPYGRMFSPDSIICSNGGAGNIWARGYYTEGAELMDKIIEKTRKEVERCDCLQGFQIVHSTGGGTGSGMGSLLFELVKEEYCDKVVNSCSIIPSPMVSDAVVESFNTVLSAENLVNDTDESFIIDNEALYSICQNRLNIKHPCFSDLNHIVSHALAGITTCFRFPGQLNTDLRKLYTNMVPYPNLHFFIPVFAPLSPLGPKCYKRTTVPDLVSQLFEPENMMVAHTSENSKYLACAAIFRGRMSTRLVDDTMTSKAEELVNNFASFMPKNFDISICDIPPIGFKIAATFIMNSTAIRDAFQRMLDNYILMLRRRAFIHWYIGEGMEEGEFTEAIHFLKEEIEQYDIEGIEKYLHRIPRNRDEPRRMKKLESR